MACKNQLCCYTPTNQYVHVIAWWCSAGQIVFIAVHLCLGEALAGCKSSRLPPTFRPGGCPTCLCCAKGMGGNFPIQKMQKSKHSILVTAMEGSMCSSMGWWETSRLGFLKGLSFVCHGKKHNLV